MGKKSNDIAHLFRSAREELINEILGILNKQEDVKDIAQKFGAKTAPFVGTMTVPEAEELVKKGFSSFCTPAGAPAFPAEGLVGRPSIPLLTRLGRRVIVKIKTCDYQQLESKLKNQKQ